MNLEYNYWYFKSAIPPDICDQIVEMGLTEMYDQKEKWGDEAVNANTGGWNQKPIGSTEEVVPVNAASVEELVQKKIDHNKAYVRDSNVVFMNHNFLYDLIWPYIHQANASAGWNWDWDFTEDFQFTKYAPGQFYGWHADSASKPFRKFDEAVDQYHKNPDGSLALSVSGDPMAEDHLATFNPKMVGKIRKLSMTLSLNDSTEYEGGNLRFDFGPHREERYHTCTEIHPKGSIIVFPSHVYHQVTPVTKGTRYSLVAWSLGAPFR